MSSVHQILSFYHKCDKNRIPYFLEKVKAFPIIIKIVIRITTARKRNNRPKHPKIAAVIL